MSGSLITALLEGLGLGGGLIIAIGAQNAYVLRQGLRREHVFAVASICFVVDLTLIALGAGGFASLITRFPGLPDAAAWGGAVFLAFYGLRAFRAAIAPGALKAEEANQRQGSLRAVVLTALALSLLNPHVYLDTVVVLGGIAAQYPPNARTAFAGGAMAASFVWFYGLGYGAKQLAPFFAKPSAWRLLDGLVGCVMWTIAAGLIWRQLHT